MGKDNLRKIEFFDLVSPDSACTKTRSNIITRRAAKELRNSENSIPLRFNSLPRYKQTKQLINSRRTTSNHQRKLVCTQTRSKIITRQASKELQSYENPIPSFYKQAKRLINARQTKSDEQKKLDTNVFESYLEDLWSNISEKKRNSYTYLDCLWFSLHKKGRAEAKVLNWIQKKQIFSRKYVFVPIICWRHWSLLILCHFGGKRQTKTKKPCMLLLDSLQNTDPKRLEPDIRRFVFDIYRSEGRKEKKEFISEIPLLIPKVPQQRNGEECGMFVLYFIYQFLQSDPANFSEEGYPHFLNENWFDMGDLENFRKEIRSFWVNKECIQIQ